MSQPDPSSIFLEQVPWKDQKFSRVPSSGLLPFIIYIGKGAKLNDDGHLPTEAELLLGLQGLAFACEKVNELLAALPDVLPCPLVVVFLPDERFQALTGVRYTFAQQRVMQFPDESPYAALICKSSYFPENPLPPQGTWQEEQYRNAVADIHELFHLVLRPNQIAFCLSIEEGLVELIPRLVLGYQHFMPLSSHFLSQLARDGSTEGEHPNKLHTIDELRDTFRRYPEHRPWVNPSYGSAFLFVVGYFLELQKRLVRQEKKYKDPLVLLNRLIKELSTHESPGAVVARLAELIGQTPEFLGSSYYFQEKGQAWVLQRTGYATRFISAVIWLKNIFQGLPALIRQWYSRFLARK